MHKNRRLLPLCAAIAAVTGAASETAVASLMDSFSDDSTAAGGASVTLDLFDSSLGTLLGVTLSIDSDWNTSLTVDYDGPEGGTGNGAETYLVSGESAHNLAVSGLPGGGTGSVSLGNLTASCTYPGGNGDADTASSCDNFTDGADANMLDGDIGALFAVVPAYSITDFIGIGTFSFDLEALASQVSCDHVTATHTATAPSCTFVTNWSGEVTVAYDYRPYQSVPVPGTLVMLGIGLAGLSLRRRT